MSVILVFQTAFHDWKETFYQSDEIKDKWTPTPCSLLALLLVAKTERLKAVEGFSKLKDR